MTIPSKDDEYRPLTHTETLQAIAMILDEFKKTGEHSEKTNELLERLLTAVYKHEETVQALRADMFKIMFGMVSLSLVLAWIIR